jgi:hypothetical protein
MNIFSVLSRCNLESRHFPTRARSRFLVVQKWTVRAIDNFKFLSSFTDCRHVVTLLLEMKKLYSRLKSKRRSNSPGGSDPSGAAGSSSIATDQAPPTYGAAVGSDRPAETTAGPAVFTQGHKSGSVPQGPQTTSALMIAANAATAVAAPAIASHDSQKVKHGADTPVPATSPSERAQIGQLAYNAAAEILPLIQAAAEAIPVAGSPIKAVIGGLLKVMNALDVGACILRHSWRANTIALV